MVTKWPPLVDFVDIGVSQTLSKLDIQEAEIVSFLAVNGTKNERLLTRAIVTLAEHVAELKKHATVNSNTPASEPEPLPLRVGD